MDMIVPGSLRIAHRNKVVITISFFIFGKLRATGAFAKPCVNNLGFSFGARLRIALDESEVTQLYFVH